MILLPGLEQMDFMIGLLPDHGTDAFPKGSNIGAIFAEGIVWGGKVNDGQSPTGKS